MRQKFYISREADQDKLNIKEYAMVQKEPKKASSSMLSNETFAFLGEETYDGAFIEKAIERGMRALVTALRTHNLFPIGPYAVKIAESVMELYGSQDGSEIELFFDDIDQFKKEPVLGGG